MTKDELKQAVESLLDNETPNRVFEALVEVCGEKAEHVRSVWADTRRARTWLSCMHSIDKAAFKASEDCL